MTASRIVAALVSVSIIVLGSAPLPAESGASTREGPIAFVSNSSSGTISVVDADTMTPIGDPIDVGSQPRGSALTTDCTRLLVCDRSDNVIAVLNTETLAVATSIPLTGSGPNDIAVHPDGSKAYVACRQSNTICVVDLATMQQTNEVEQLLGSSGPKGIAITPDGTRCYTANSGSSNVDVFLTDTESFGVAIPTSQSSRDIRISVDGSTAIAVGSEPIFIDTATNTEIVTGLPSVETSQRHVDVAGNRAYVTLGFVQPTATSALAVYDLDPFALVDTIPLTTTGIEGVSVQPDGKTAWVSVREGTVLQEIDLESKTLGETALVGEGPRHITLLPPPSINVPPPNTIRSFLLPKKLDVRVGVGKKKAPGVTAKGFFDTGPDDVDFRAPAMVTIGPRTVAVPSLTQSKNGRQFTYTGQNLDLTVTPSRIGTSKGKFKLSLTEDLAGQVDLNGQFTISYEGGGIDATGTVILQDGSFKFGRTPGTLIAPAIDIRKAKANLPGVGKHKFKFVAGLAGNGVIPAQAPDVFVAFGDIFNADLPTGALRRKGKNFVLAQSVAGGIKAVTLSPAKERISVRGGNTDIGDIPEGPFPLLLIVRQDGEADVRAVLVRAVRTKKQIKY